MNMWKQKLGSCYLGVNQRALSTNNLLSLPHLLVRRKNGRELLVDYSQSHVVISNQYLNIMCNKRQLKGSNVNNHAKLTKKREEKQTIKATRSLIKA
jgi:hypothetical protein